MKINSKLFEKSIDLKVNNILGGRNQETQKEVTTSILDEDECIITTTTTYDDRNNVLSTCTEYDCPD